PGGLRGRAALLGQREDALGAVELARHELLLLHRLEGRVDRAGSGVPGAAAAVRELLDDLVAVHRRLREEAEDGRLDIAPTGAVAAAERPEAARSAPAGSVLAVASPAGVMVSPAPARSAEGIPGRGVVVDVRDVIHRDPCCLARLSTARLIERVSRY